MFSFLSAVNELCRVLIAAVIVNVDFYQINCIHFSCSLDFLVFTKTNKQTKTKPNLPEQLKTRQQQRAQGPKANTASL